MSEIVHVGMADYKLCRSPQKISTLGLGSCLGVVLYDQTIKVCGMAHIMMPDSNRLKRNTNRMKFADTCLRDMLDDLLAAGASQSRMIAKIAGGARMFIHKSNTDFLNIGKQNAEAVRKVLGEWNIPIIAEDVGSNFGRTIEFDTVTGELFIKSVGKGDYVI